MVLTLVIVGVTAIVGVLIFVNVSNTTDSIFDPDRAGVTNESVTITASVIGQDNSTLLAQAGFVVNSEVVRNASEPFITLTRDVDYRITITGTDGALDNRANFTLINITDGVGNDSTFNNSPLFVSYSRNIKSESQLSVEVIETTVLDAYELGVIALIVLAAVVILAILFKLGSQ